MKGKEELKVFLFADDMIVYVENPTESSKKLRKQINEFSKTAEQKINIISILFLYIPARNHWKTK